MNHHLSRWAALSLVFVASAIHAAPAADAPRVVVSYADLDLTRPAGVARLAMRVRSGINNACRTVAGGRSLSERRLERACRKDLSTAVAPKMTALTTASATRLASIR